MDEYINQIRARVFQRMDLSRDMLDEEIEEFISEDGTDVAGNDYFTA